jgi:class 3 adenylate cyclase
VLSLSCGEVCDGREEELAAILAADVVGFSRLTSADEDRTLARLRALRSDLIDPTIAVHNGRVIKRCSQQEWPTRVRDGVRVSL